MHCLGMPLCNDQGDYSTVQSLRQFLYIFIDHLIDGIVVRHTSIFLGRHQHQLSTNSTDQEQITITANCLRILNVSKLMTVLALINLDLQIIYCTGNQINLHIKFKDLVLQANITKSVYHRSRCPEHQVWLHSKLSSCHSCDSGMIGLNASTGDDVITAFVKSITHQELQLTNLDQNFRLKPSQHCMEQTVNQRNNKLTLFPPSVLPVMSSLLMNSWNSFGSPGTSQ